MSEEDKQQEVIEKAPVTQEKMKTENELAQEFVVAHNKFCVEHGYKIVTSPIFQLRDDGTYSVVLQTGVSKLSTVIK